MKRWVLLVPFLFPSSATAYSTIYNPFTSKLDYVGVSTSSLTGNFVANQNTLQSGATFYVSSGTVAGQLSISGTGAGELDITEGAQPTAVSGKEVFYADSTAHQLKVSNNGGSFNTLGAPGGSNTQFQYNNASAFAGTAYMIIQSTGITVSTATVYSGITNWTISKSLYATFGDTATFNANAIVNSSFTVVATTATAYSVTISTISNSSWHVAISTNGHIVTNTPPATVPTISSCGATPNGSVTGDDNEGTITVGGGVVTACTLTFANSWGTTPVCIISDNSTAVTGDISAVSATAFTSSFSASLGGGKVYYRCGCSGSSCL